MPDDLKSLFEADLVFNGVNAVTGEYGQPPLSSRQLARLIRGQPLPEDYREFVERQRHLGALTNVQDRLQRVTDVEFTLHEQAMAARLEELKFKARSQMQWPVKPGAGDISRVEDVGWAVIFPAAMNPALREEIKEALGPLLNHRRAQAGDLFRVCEGSDAYRTGERKDQYFRRVGIGAGLADPDEFPFYVLLVGTPDEIPFAFQYQLDVMRGVGRLDFGSDVEAYADYARAVVAAETGQVVLPRRAAFFAPANPGDKATELSSEYLVQPVFENLSVASPENELALLHEWELLSPFVGDGQATHSQLGQLLGGAPGLTPALLFTASHGIEFPANHPAQLRHQGALLCQDWPGPGETVRREHYFTGEDIDEEANLTGMVAFLFACYGAGTPELDQFAATAFKVREKIAPRNFTAALPQRLLRYGMLAVIGHVERAWGYSFISPGGRLEHQTFITSLRTLMNGDPIGLATDASFNMRYAELSSDLAADLDELQWNPDYISDYELAHRWTANNDARSYVVLGDPAVRIPFEREAVVDEGPVDLGTITAEVPAAEGPQVPPPLPEIAGEGRVKEGAAEAPQEEGDVVVEMPPPLPDTPPDEIKIEAQPEAPTPLAEAEELVAERAGPSVATPQQAGDAPSAGGGAPTIGVAPAVIPTTPGVVPPAQGPRQLVRVQPVYVEGEAAYVAFGLSDQFEKLKVSLRRFTDQLATSLGHAAEDIVTLDVRTYSARDIRAVAAALDAHQDPDATLRALTRVDFDGDVQVYIPEKADSGFAQLVLAVHKAMVEEAQTSRARFLATMAELATSLLNSLRIGS